MEIKIKHITRQESIEPFRIFQRIDGDLVEGVMRPDKEYIFWLGAKRWEDWEAI